LQFETEDADVKLAGNHNCTELQTCLLENIPCSKIEDPVITKKKEALCKNDNHVLQDLKII
jgi:hypothetical protein